MFSIKSFGQAFYLCAFLLAATMVAEAKIETPNKPAEGSPSKSVPVLHMPWVYRNHPLLSKPSLPLRLDPIRFTLIANKDTIVLGEEVELTITAQLLDIPSSAFFIFEEQKSFSIKLLLPQGFTQMGGDYEDYCGGRLSAQNSLVTKHIRGVFHSLPDNPCFVLLRGAFNANANSIFEQKQVLCFSKKIATKATREATCVSPVLTPITSQTNCQGVGFYMVSTSVTNGVDVNYQWFNDNGTANNNTDPIVGQNRANLSIFPTAAGVYKYKVVATSVQGTSCSASQNVTLTVKALPTVVSTTATNPNCAPLYGGTIAVEAAGSNTLLYSKDNGGNWTDLTGNSFPDEITRNTLLYGTEQDYAKVKITLADGFGLGPGGEYSGEIKNQITGPPSFQGLAAGTYSIRVKDEHGCVSAPTNVSLSNPNAPTFFAVSGSSACGTTSTPINLSGSVAGVNYQLQKNGINMGAPQAGTGGALSFGSQSAVGTYTVIATNTTTQCNALMNNSVLVSTGNTVAAAINSGGDKIYCAANVPALSVSVGGGQTADWYATATGGTPLSGGNGVLSFVPTAAGVYYVESRDVTTQCKSSTRTPVTLYAAPTLSITGNTLLGCENTSTLLKAQLSTPVPTGTSVNYVWKSSPNGPVLANTDTLRVTSVDTYTLSFSYSSCSLTASQSVSSSVTTDSTIVLSSNASIGCSGSLTIVPTISNTTASTVYKWNGPDGFSANTANIEVTQAGTYTLSVKKNATTPCGTQEIFVAEKSATPQEPLLSASRLSIDPENGATLLARGCSGAVSWSYIVNDPIVDNTSTPVTNGVSSGSQSPSVITIAPGTNASSTLTLTYQNTPFQTSATYMASCVGVCTNSAFSVPITIFKNICGISVKADKNAVAANTPVMLTAFFCETANITWSTGAVGTRSITVTPAATTTYFAVCKLPSTGASCSSSVEVKVSAADCPSNFAISASATSIQKGEVVTLTANGCTGSLTWSNGVQQSTAIKVMPTENATFYATCTTTEGSLCYSNAVSIVITQTSVCLSAIYYEKTYLQSGTWFTPTQWSTTIFPSGCQNGTLSYIHQGNVKNAYKQGYSYVLSGIRGDITVTATCTMPDGTTCSKTLAIPQPSKDCNNLMLSIDSQRRITASNGEPFILTDDTGKQLNQTAYTSIKVPISTKDRFYTAKFENGCEVANIVKGFNFTLYWKSNINTPNDPSPKGDMFDISKYVNEPSSPYRLTIYQSSNESYNTCTGQIIWTNDQDPAFRYEGSDLIFNNSNVIEGSTFYLPMPSSTTTYYATCYQNGVTYPATNSKTLVVNALGGCLTVTRDAWQITHGNSVTLKASGCLGQITWTFNGATVGTGSALTHTPILSSTPGDATYTATCTNPACSQTTKLRVQPCQLSIAAPKTLVKIAEPLLLSAKGCSGGVVVWDTGETGSSITVKPLTNTTYSATCAVNGQTLCTSNSLAIAIDNQAPADIECPQLTVSTVPLLGKIFNCTTTTVDITAHCQNGDQIIWGDVNDPNSIRTTPGQTRSFNLSQSTLFTVTCINKYQQSDQKVVAITAVDEPISIYPTAVNAGVQTILTASGCRGNNCEELGYLWQEKGSAKPPFIGKTNKVTLFRETTYIITCSNGTSKEITVTVNSSNTSCNLSVKRGGGCENGTHRLAIYTAQNCNTSFPIYWYRGVYSGAVQDYTDYQLTHSNVTVVTENLSNPTAYKVVCMDGNGKQCVSFAEPPSGAEFCYGLSINIAIGGKTITIDPNNPGAYGANSPSPCDKLEMEAKGGKIASPRGSGPQYDAYFLTSDWCNGSKVTWYNAKGVKLVTLTPPFGHYDIPDQLLTKRTYQYECELTDGTVCSGNYEIGPGSAATTRIGASQTETVVQENICATSLILSTPLAVELATLICAHVELLKNPDGSISSVKVAAFLAALKASVSSRYAANGITVVFPADDAPIIAAIMAQNCQSAGQLLAAPNTATITATLFNTVKNSTHQPILQDLKPILIAECSTTQISPTLEAFTTITNGRVAALDPNRYFIAPDGRAVKLPVGATPEFFSFQVPYFTPPTGTLQGIKTADGKRYFADIAIGSGTFFGFRLWENSLTCPGIYLDNLTNLYAALPTLPAVNVYYIENYKANGRCGYRFVESQYSFVPTPKTIVDLAPLTGTPLETWTKACPEEEIVEVFGNKFKLTTLNNTITKVQGTWQTFGKCPTCPAVAEAALQAALSKAKAKNGSITSDTKIIEAVSIPYGDPTSPNFLGNIVYSDMKLLDILTNLSKTYNSLVDKAKVPEAVWQPQEDLPAEDKNFFVQDKTRVISGALDQAAEEVKDIPELVGLGLKVVSDPVGAKDELINFAQNMSWQKAKDFAKEAAKSTVQYDYLTNPKTEYQLYGTGRLGVSIVKLAAGGAALKFAAITKKAPDFLALWNRLRDKMDNLSWTQTDKDRFRADLETVDESVLKRFDDGFLDIEASKALVLGEPGSGSSGKNLRRIEGNLRTLTQVRTILPSDLSMEDIRGLLLNSSNKQDILTELAKFDATNLDELRDLLKKRGLLTFAVKKADVPFNGSPSGVVLGQVANRQTARQAAQNIDISSPNYDVDYKAQMKAMRDASEKSAELMADIHFGKANEIELSLPNTTAKQGQFDRVYKTTDPQTGAVTWNVVECKGGASELGSRQGHQQCTKPYIDSVIQYLRNTNQLTNDQLDRLDELEEALNMTPSKVKSWKLQQKFDDDGNLGTTGVTEYNI